MATLPFPEDCSIWGGYEYFECEAEWDAHHWEDWSDAELAAAGIRPESFERYRREPERTLQYAACEDQIQGHIMATKNDDFFEYGRCISCDKRVE